jgi:hypothetical protein
MKTRLQPHPVKNHLTEPFDREGREISTQAQRPRRITELRRRFDVLEILFVLLCFRGFSFVTSFFFTDFFYELAFSF